MHLRSFYWLKGGGGVDYSRQMDIHCCRTLRQPWQLNNSNNIIFFPKTLTAIPKTFSPPSSLSSHARAHLHSHPLQISRHNNSTKNTTLLVEAFHENQRLKVLIQKLSSKASSPLQILTDDGDWSNHHFWAVMRFLKHSSRSREILQVFQLWKGLKESRINQFNYEKIIGFLSEEGLTEESLLALQDLKANGLKPSLEIYNSIIHCYARKGEFDRALSFLDELKENGLSADTETYDGLIQSYGKYKMYDELNQCVKKMQSDGCIPDRITYNLLIQEFCRGGLLKRMERVYRTVLSKRMDLQSSTLIAMLETYANFGIVEKMEMVYRRVLNSKAILEDDLIRKLAGVYIENYKFSRLTDMGLDLSSITGRTDLVWCLLLLSNACVSSRKGMDSIVKEMEAEKVPWNVTVANTILLAYLKMKDFRRLRILLLELSTHQVKPDIVTVGILFDANRIGFNGTMVLNSWGRMGFLDEAAEMNTDPLVLSAFGKGNFLRSCEEKYSSLEPQAREKKAWTYYDLIDLVFKHPGRPSSANGS